MKISSATQQVYLKSSNLEKEQLCIKREVLLRMYLLFCMEIFWQNYLWILNQFGNNLIDKFNKIFFLIMKHRQQERRKVKSKKQKTRKTKVQIKNKIMGTMLRQLKEKLLTESRRIKYLVKKISYILKVNLYHISIYIYIYFSFQFILERINTASCSSEQGLLLRIPKQIYYNMFNISKLKSKSQDSIHNDESPSLQTADFFVRQNFTNLNTRNIDQNQQPQTTQTTDLQGSQLIFSQKSTNRQFTKLQISQMQNNSAAITQFSKTNKQLLNILNNKLQHQSSGSQQNQSNGLSTNKQSEDSGSASNKNARNFHLQQFSSANFSQGQLSNSSSKCFSPIVSNCDVNEHSPTKIKLSQFRVKKYQSERSISMAKQNIEDKVEDSDNKVSNKNILDQQNLQSFTNKLNEIQDVKNSFRKSYQFQSANKNSSPVVAQQGFQLKLNSGVLQKHQKNISSRHSDIVLASHELQQSSSSQRGCQSPEKTSFSPANPMRRTFLIDQSTGTIIKKRALHGIQFGSQANLQKPNSLNEFDDQKFNKQASDEFNYPNSDGIEGDTQKNSGKSPVQTFSMAAKQQCDNIFQKASICNESSPNVSVSDALRKSKISFQYRKKPSSVAVGSCSDFQSLKNIDADQFSKEIQTNINAQISNKFVGKNSSAIFFSNNFEKSPLSSQQNLPSWKSTAATKLQMNLSNQTSPKKNFILKKSQILIQSNNGSMQQIPSIHNFINNQESDSQKKQNELNSQSSRLEDSNDSSFMIYDDYANHLASQKQNIDEPPQNQQTNENESNQQKSKKPKPSIPLLDLKSITQNQQINNFFNNIPNQQNQQQNQNQKSTEQNVNKFQDSKSIIDQKQSTIQQTNQQNQTINLQKQVSSSNQRPSTPSIKKLDLSNLNEQLKKQTPQNVQKEEGFAEITQSRLILPSFNQNINSSHHPQETKTPQSTKFDFFSPCKIQDDIKVFEKNIFQTAQQAQNNIFFANQPNQQGLNKSKQTIQNINSLYQGLLTSQNFKKQSMQSNSRKNTINLKELS
ncbi:hypothetical protein ABPG74_002152 [Tetrahymena malaccensis]